MNEKKDDTTNERSLSAFAQGKLKKGIYMVPTVITLGNLSLGFFSIVKSTLGEFTVAATAIFLGHILDVLDGRVARWSGTASRFGVELDSFADWMTFGIAPAVLMYEMILKHQGPWGFPVALIFVICASLRLARFNIKAHEGEGKTPHFVGLPSPVAGGTLAMFALLFDIIALDKPARTIKVVMTSMGHMEQAIPAVMLALALLMVSDVRYSTFKNINLLRPRGMRAIVLTLFIGMMIYIYPQNMLFILYVSYIVWGLTDSLIHMGRRDKDGEEVEDDLEDEVQTIK